MNLDVPVHLTQDTHCKQILIGTHKR
jgi:hypothetical protein